MAGRGPAPSGRRQRERANRSVTAVKRVNRVHGPMLPKAEDVFEAEFDSKLDAFVQPEWHPMTVKWWDSMRRSPLTTEAGPEGWAFLLDTAMLHHKAWKGDVRLMPEVRLRAAKFGVTPEDRARLGVAVESPEAPAKAAGARRAAEAKAGVSSLEERRKRIAG